MKAIGFLIVIAVAGATWQALAHGQVLTAAGTLLFGGFLSAFFLVGRE